LWGKFIVSFIGSVVLISKYNWSWVGSRWVGCFFLIRVNFSPRLTRCTFRSDRVRFFQAGRVGQPMIGILLRNRLCSVCSSSISFTKT
jgi:hypothetical protein